MNTFSTALTGVIFCICLTSAAENPTSGVDSKAGDTAFLSIKGVHAGIQQGSAGSYEYDPAAATATEIASGVLFGKFAKEDGPFLITGNIIVPADQVLEFGPGSHIYVAGTYTTITVYGQLLIKGSATEQVIIESGRKVKNPWDWDRIYCRSRGKSVFEQCIIKHSNYGIVVENGGAEITRCRFEKNSIHGLVVKNGQVTVSKSQFFGGHVAAVVCQAGSVVSFDSCTIRYNSAAVVCEDYASISMESGSVQSNTYGVALKKNGRMSIVATEITRNRIGLIAEQDIALKMREMVYNNSTDFRIATSDELEKIFAKSDAVRSLLVEKNTPVAVASSGFTPGFSAHRLSKESSTSFIGSVSTGMHLYSPHSHHHPVDIDSTTGSHFLYRQKKYLGEFNSHWYSKVQPELQVFAQGKNGPVDLSINSDFYANDWISTATHMRTNALTMAFNYENQSCVLGDFYENFSENSMASRRLRGFKYTNAFLPMGRGMNKIELHAAAGQSEEKKDVGDHIVDVFGDTVNSGSTVRQQLTYVVHATVKPTHTSSIALRGIFAHDQDEKVLFSDPVTDTAVSKPISSQTSCIEGSVGLLDGMVELNAELDIGTHDTVAQDKRDAIAWYNPFVVSGISRIVSVLDPDSANYAIALSGRSVVRGYSSKLTFSEIAQHYYSAGNPYFQPDRRFLTAKVEREFSSAIQASADYTFDQTAVSNSFATDQQSSTFKNALHTVTTYAWGTMKPSINLNYTICHETKDELGGYDSLTQKSVVDSTGSMSVVEVFVTAYKKYSYLRLDNEIGIEWKQQISDGFDYSVNYAVALKNDLSIYPRISDKNLDDSWENTLSGRVGFKAGNWLREKVSARVKYRSKIDDNARKFEYKLSNESRINVIGRTLSLLLKPEYHHVSERKDQPSGAGRQTIISYLQSFETGFKYTISSRLSSSITAKYERCYDENQSSAENYTVIIGGVLVTYLF
ncbi:MAG: right-handed parallel beta-helix repeat-containing protein [Chitinivibrionales bacterium]|nr:right-handed parallel beta-helix repeat-containing protein [Chitinivibrionales bacterium]